MMNKTFACIVALSIVVTPCMAFAKGSSGGHAASSGHASSGHVSTGKGHHATGHMATLASAKATVLGHTTTTKSSLGHSKKG